MNSFKPTGYNSVSPYFITEEADKLIELLIKIFGGEITRSFDTPDGNLMHAEVRLDDSILMFSEASERYPANQHLMHVYVVDVDEVFEKAIALGCTPGQKPESKNENEDTDRRGSFIDFAGNHWFIASQVRN